MPHLNRPAHSKTTLGDCSFSFASSSVWNSIPNDVRCAPSLSSFKDNGILYHDSKTKAELLNHQFKSVFTIDDDTDHLPTMSHPKYPNIENITISIEGVEKLLDNINIHKASGPDKIPNIILKT